MVEPMDLPSSAPSPVKQPTPTEAIVSTRALTVRAGERTILSNVNLSILPRQVFGIIGPSGAGKSTLLKCLNRLIELTPGLKVSGDVQFHQDSIYAANVDVDSLRARIGILFQQPVVFPKSILQNVIFGTRHLGKVPRKEWPEVAERALREAALWNEVKDRSRESALRLSVGQQQRLCLARTLAVDPEVILMDEPTSALDPKSTEAIEELILQLKQKRTLILVTHNLDQARRVADWLACIEVRNGAGELVECAACSNVLASGRRKDISDCCES
ncbi:MAG TPA: phosphate ABC transporter ATP-binding protein [Methylomirabilota bacterium]|nr:phosphate ABC transporter ATP-binding protein [Methylomirabilota bacterium]